MSLVYAAVVQMTKMLQNLDAWLEEAVAHAATRSFDPEVLVTQRLTPDQYPLVRQVQSSCDTAKFAAARLSGKEAPKHPDHEKTMGELRSRVKTAVAYLETYKADDFKDADQRRVDLPFREGQSMHGLDYLLELAQPNFYFHLNHAYAILRHNGVALGKTKYLGSLKTFDR